MHDNYIFGSGDVSGVLAIAAVKSVLQNPFIRFVSASKLKHDLNHYVQRSSTGSLYIANVNLGGAPVDEFNSVLSRKKADSKFFDHHNLPSGIVEADLGFNETTVDHSVSSCESIYTSLRLQLDPLIPAMASLNDGFTATPSIQSAAAEYGNNLRNELKILQFGLANRIRDAKFKRGLVDYFALGGLPSQQSDLKESFEEGLQVYGGLVSLVEENVVVSTDFAYATFEELEGAYAALIADHIAQSNEKAIGATVLQYPGEGRSKITVANSDPTNFPINIGDAVQGVAMQVQGLGYGSRHRGTAYVPGEKTEQFLQSLDKVLTPRYEMTP